jgi:carbon monoxide dehydrogenase subunit G
VKIVDEFAVAAPLAHTWSVIRDPQKVASCVPGCRSVETIDQAHHRVERMPRALPLGTDGVDG